MVVHIPSKSDILKVGKGTFVKLVFSEGEKSERMWVRVTQKEGSDFEGILDNDPYQLISIKCGDLVKFKADNIINIFE